MVDFELAKGDLEPEITGQLLQNAVAVDLTTATSVEFHMEDVDGVVKVNAAASIVTALEGRVKYEWVGTDTDTAGKFFGEWEVIWPTARPSTFPPKKPKISIIIHDDIA